MKLSSTAVPLVTSQAAYAASAIDYNAAPPNLSTLANGSLYDTWRPRAHVLPPLGKIGDPCAHYSDPETGLFHVGWLYNGTGISGATTDDLVRYHDINPNGSQFITPGGKNDPIAVFDGSIIEKGIDGKPTLLYTSVTSLPIHWSIPYNPGAETQSLAVSTDGGRNFTKLDRPPVIPLPPSDLNVTAFRDPYAFQSPELDAASKSAPGTWYAAISGGVHEEGPGQFLYRQDQKELNLEDWEYLGQWWHEKVNTTWGNGDWAGGWGFNFEVGNTFGLNDEGYSLNGEMFMTLGTEGSGTPIVPQLSSIHDMLWVAGNVSNNGNVTFTPSMAGVLDWGASGYAAAGKILPATSKASIKSGAPDRFISFVWLTGDLFEQAKGFPSAQQNWLGTLLLPRELRVQTISNVVDNELSREAGTSWRVERGQSGIELKTMGIEIARETREALMSGPKITEPKRTSKEAGVVPFQISPTTKFYALTAQLSFPRSARNSDIQAGFQVLSSDLESTTIYYQFSNESIIVDRSHTSAAAKTTNGIVSTNESGRLRLFDLQGEGEEIETLDLTIVVDNAVIEVYANGRFALGTWARYVYPHSRQQGID
ncbi:glycoside hydrolase family 32 protein [Aspergillus alliaceus]|uniref:glycoside hydrolase family 32 protein n=1 Tax=Petromyces alliaceus TaxID=209559 RepID=UPI0012A4977F|nr:glycosyl hydrolase [Aspergillus alliaceus]KAB8235941.1 glycosyl hydrolase [Aspergillus alliaceus]